tara:strand:- start:618 stop:1547 length:930 start_codon:yes stop_codon:yes gene_type:complete
MTDKKAVDVSSLSRQIRDRLSKSPKELKAAASGVACGVLREPVPQYIKADCEKVKDGGNNTWIVMGRDRPASRMSGYGGKGDTQAGMIDIIVGRMGAGAQSENENGETVYADPNFKMDAARVYISQKADIDQYLGLASGVVGDARAKSAIALKADHLRLVSREGIKLVTRTDKKNSQGGDVMSAVGIDLIAGNDDSDLQPMVKGKNTEEALKQLTHHVDKLNGIVDSFLTYQMQFNAKLTNHFHYSPFFGKSTSPSQPVVAAGQKCSVNLLQDTKLSLVKHKANLVMYKNNYLVPSGKKYISSRYNNVN